MKICFTSQGQDIESEVDPRFGRARYFIIYDDQTREHDVADNQQNANAAAGAGVQAATNVVQKDCQWVVTGHIGPKAMSVLKEAGVKVATGVTGSVSQAVEQFLNGQLKEADSADVAPHW
jgi:predicted Fe-Mo cluster-binding NifX family protein